jgi:hypothetical protein
MPRKAVSRAQARFLGAVAGGRISRKGLSPRKAREMLRGTKYKALPPRRRTGR